MTWSGTSAQHIVDKDRKFVLGLIWSLIYARRLSGSGDGVAGKKGLLLWVQRRLAKEDSAIVVSDFTTSWSDGLALAALVRSIFGSDAIRKSAIADLSPKERVAASLEVAANGNVPKLVEPEWVVDGVDERALMTYLSELFFAAKRADDGAASEDVIRRVLEAAAAAAARRSEYAAAAQTIKDFAAGVPTFATLEGRGGAVRRLVSQLQQAVEVSARRRDAGAALQAARAAAAQYESVVESNGLASVPLQPPVDSFADIMMTAASAARTFVTEVQTARAAAVLADSATWAHVRASCRCIHVSGSGGAGGRRR